MRRRRNREGERLSCYAMEAFALRLLREPDRQVSLHWLARIMLETTAEFRRARHL